MLYVLGKHPDGVPAAYWEYLQKARWFLVLASVVSLGFGVVGFGTLVAMILFGIDDVLELLRAPNRMTSI